MSRPLEIARQYMQIFYGGQSLDLLYELFAEDFSFIGPFYQFDSVHSYIESLKSDPPMGCDYKIIKAYEDDDSACLVYEFIKPGASTLMTQLFEINDEKITDIVLVFDTAAFK